jgi:chondroitin AC lyase
MEKTFKYLTATFIFLLIALVSVAQTDFDIIKKRVVDELMKPRVDDDHTANLINTLRDDGTWPGINYEDVSRTGFQHSRHSGNMVSLARAYKTRDSKHHKSKKVRSTIELALKNWVDNDYFCDNWWYNQIGTPDNLVSLMLIVGDELPKDLVDKAQPIIGRAHLTASGARPSGDRIKIAGILAKNLLFIGDTKQFDEVMKVIEGEIKFTTGSRGLQHDYSFHHREDRVNNTLSYGLGYADAFAEWANYVGGTSYAFTREKIAQLTDYYLDGICKQLIYGKINDPGTKNRDISRPGSIRAYGTTTPERLMRVSDYRKSELDEIIKIRKGEAPVSLSFGKFFWQTEHYSHQRPDYFTSVRLYSVRNRNMEEPYNSEGLKNHHRADGTNYLSLNGDEYNNMAPVYDWQKIPGTTVVQKPELPAENQIQKDGLTDFVGAVTDGLYGAVAFDFKSPHDPLSAKKSWFFFDEEYVCLGADINTRASLPVATTLNQCLLDGEVTAMASGRKLVLSEGEHKLENISWIYHDGVGYLFPAPVNANLLNMPQTGNWYDINQQSDISRDDVTLPVFKLWLDHGTRPAKASYEYIVVPAVTAAQLEAGKTNRNIKILSNTADLQAVCNTALNICQAVFYRAGELDVTNNLKVVMDSPGVVMIKSDDAGVKEISVSDPSRKLGRMHLSVSGEVAFKNENVKCYFDRNTNSTAISIALPQTVFAGSSVSVR